VRCGGQDAGASDKPERGKCEIYKRIVIGTTGQRAAEFAIGFPDNKDRARGVIIMPLGILLRAESGKAAMRMVVDDGEPFEFRPRYCDAGGCYAYLSLSETVLDMFRKGEAVSLLLHSRDGKPIRIEMSLKGITRALKKIS
jgi:invasion protein IalB